LIKYSVYYIILDVKLRHR